MRKACNCLFSFLLLCFLACNQDIENEMMMNKNPSDYNTFVLHAQKKYEKEVNDVNKDAEASKAGISKKLSNRKVHWGIAFFQKIGDEKGFGRTPVLKK